MKLLTEVARQRARFLQDGEAPNRLLCPLRDKYALLGECFEAYRPAGIDSIHVMGLKVIFSEQVSCVEVAVVRE